MLVASVVTATSVLLALSVDSCGLAHVDIVHGLDAYNELDPELCMELLDKIYRFNDKCGPPVEIIDCG